MLYPKITKTRDLVDLSGLWKIKLNKDNENIDVNKKLNSKTLVAVPGSFNDQLAFHNEKNYIGDFYYEKEFILSDDIKNKKRAFLRFASATHNATVYLNGKELGSHKGGFTPFEFEITDKLEENNRLLVKLDNILDYTTLPVGVYTEEERNGKIVKKVSENFDFFNYAGIHRPVKIYFTNQNYIKDITIYYDLNDDLTNAKVNFDVEIDGNAKKTVIEVFDEENNLVAKTENNVLNIENVKLWQPLNAYLYNAKVSIYNENNELEDTYTEEFGIRKVEVKNNKFFINNRPFYFKGYGRHEDTFTHGRGLNETANIQDMNLMKWTGANSFRTSHYPYSEEMMRLADREGFVVIDETPAVTLMCGFGFSELGEDKKKIGTWETLKTHKAHEQVIDEMIKRDKNHACVVMWSIANEAATNEEGAYEYFKPLFDRARNLDKQNRPCTYVNILVARPEVDKAMSLCDVICLNRYYGWYVYTSDLEKAKEEQIKELKIWHKMYPDKPIMFTEYGADTVAGLHDIDFNTPFTEEFQVKYYQMNAEVFDSLDYFVGEQLWNFADFQTKYGFQRVQGNKKGIFTRERSPKMAAFEIKKRWDNIPDFDYKK